MVIHLAAEINVDKSLEDPALFIQTNVIGTLNVLDAVRKSGIRMVHASTCEVYGGAEYKTMDEGHPLNPRSPYAASKAGADRLCYAYAKSFNVDVAIVRPSNIYGPRQKTGKFGAVILIFASKVMAGETPVIFGTGELPGGRPDHLLPPSPEGEDRQGPVHPSERRGSRRGDAGRRGDPRGEMARRDVPLATSSREEYRLKRMVEEV